MNAISTALARALADACAGLAADASVRAVVLSAAGEKAFCVGADLKERNEFNDDDLLAQRPVFRAAFGAVRDLPQPTVAAVHGFALGGGTELALSCDVIVAEETAVFGLPEVTVGLCPRWWWDAAAVPPRRCRPRGRRHPHRPARAGSRSTRARLRRPRRAGRDGARGGARAGRHDRRQLADRHARGQARAGHAGFGRDSSLVRSVTSPVFADQR